MNMIVKNNQCKVAIPSELFIAIPPRKENISYTLVSLIIHDVNSLDSGNFFSDVFDGNTGIWWYCSTVIMMKMIKSEICQEVVYTRESPKQKDTNKRVAPGSNKVLLLVYIRTSNLIASRSVFDK